MLFRMLKKDLKKRRVMNCILTVFIILATMFVASGLSNVFTVISGTDYYLDKAGIGDYIIISMGEGGYSAMDDFIRTNEYVKGYRLDHVLYSEQKDYSRDGKDLKLNNTVLIQTKEENGLKFFDKDNQEIGIPDKGHCYLSMKSFKDNEFKAGDQVHFKKGNSELLLTIDGGLKDACLGSDMMGNTRVLISKEDMDALISDSELTETYGGEVVYVDTDHISEFAASISDLDNVGFNGTRSVVKMTYVMSMIIAFIVLILSLVLIIVSFLVLKFAIKLSVLEDFHEIGVMKAVGIRTRKIRFMYSAKYLTLALLGAVIGGAVSFPFGKLLIGSVSENMVLGNDSDVLAHFIGIVLVILIISAFTWGSTRRIKKMSPVDAIRNGQTGERFRKKKGRRISRTAGSSEFFLARNDLRSTPKRYLSIILSIGICMMLVLVIVNTSSTMLSGQFAPTFGKVSDLYIGNLESGLIKTREQMESFLNETANKLENAGMPCTMFADVQYKYKIVFNGNTYKLSFGQGSGTKTTDYTYLSGTAPQNKNEVAITDVITDKTGLRVGDTFTLDYGDHTEECIATAANQTMNQMGEVIRLHEDAPTEFKYYSNMVAYQLDFDDHPSQKVIDERKERVKEILGAEKVWNAAEFCKETMGVADTMVALQNLLLMITLFVILLVTILMERSFVVDEKSQIAILKAVGFRNRSIVKWHVIRFAICAMIAVIAAALLSVPMTFLTITPIFRMMGLVKVSFDFNVLTLAGYMGIVLGFTLLMAWITAQSTRRVKSSDTANNE